MINYEIQHYSVDFDITLESIAKQGVLFLNSALTTKLNTPSSHFYIWEEFIINLINNISIYNPNLIWVLLGKQAQLFKRYIGNTKYIFEDYHPSYYVRNKKNMPSDIWSEINITLLQMNNTYIKWYKDYD